MCNEKEEAYLEIKRLNEEQNIGLTEDEIMWMWLTMIDYDKQINS